MQYFMMKFVMIPVVVLVTSYFLANVHFNYIHQPIIIGVILAIIGYLIEVTILKQGTFWISNTLDFIISTIIIYVIAQFFTGTIVTFGGAILLAAFLTGIEFFVHLWLIKSGRTSL